MPALAFLKSFKFWGILGGIILLASTGYFAVRTYQHAIERAVKAEQRAQDAEKAVQALQDAQRAINKAIDQGSNSDKVIEQRTHTIEERIRNVPVTTECVKSPAIGVVLGDYNQRLRAEQQDNAR